jgi:aryl-alcohol dehydrogenase-like predicted oxidoreductase
MQYAQLGSTGLQVSRICLGMMSYGSTEYQGWVLPGSEGVRHTKRALEAGVNFFDTADFYSNGLSETILGDAISELTSRNNVVLSTKVGIGLEKGPNRRGLSRKYMMAAVEDSLRRLKTDYIDLYQLHIQDFSTPLEETIDALADIVRSGKARYVGLSNYSAWNLARVHYTAKYNNRLKMSATQIQYNLAYREEERDTIPFSRVEGIGLLVYSPLARGLLAGNKLSGTSLTEREKARAETDLKAAATYGTEEDRMIAARVVGLAEQRGVSASQIALAWLLNKPYINAVTCGVLEDSHLDAAVGALDIRLDDKEISLLEELYTPRRPIEIDAPLKVGGERVK